MAVRVASDDNLSECWAILDQRSPTGIPANASYAAYDRLMTPGKQSRIRTGSTNRPATQTPTHTTTQPPRKGTSDTPAVLFDCDGVLVDNVGFERRVTEMIVEAYAGEAGLSVSEAEGLWRAELSATRGHALWFDYAYHCDRLGLNGRALSEYAHREAANLLTIVPGAFETQELLHQHGIAVGVVTDATSWVVRFKLRTVGLESPTFVFSSTDASATKATREYWQQLAKQHAYLSPRALIDNRNVNLLTARESIPDLHLIQFERQEHVMTLPSTVAPTSHHPHAQQVMIVHSHDELRAWVVGNMG